MCLLNSKASFQTSNLKLGGSDEQLSKPQPGGHHAVKSARVEMHTMMPHSQEEARRLVLERWRVG